MKNSYLLLIVFMLLLIFLLGACSSQKKQVGEVTNKEESIVENPITENSPNEEAQSERPIPNYKMRAFAKDKFLYKNENKTCPDSLNFEYGNQKYSLQFPRSEWYGKPDKAYLNPILLIDGIESLKEIARSQLKDFYVPLRMDADYKIDLQSEDLRYVFLPCGPLILDLETMKIIQLARPSSEFLGNLFYENYHLSIYSDALSLTDLSLGMTSTIILHDETIIWAEIAEGNKLIYSTFDKPLELRQLNHRVFSKENSSAQKDYLKEANHINIFHGKENKSEFHEESHLIDGIKYDVILTGDREPNNGRMVMTGDFLISDNKFIRMNRSPYLKWEISNVEFFSPDHKYIFIPYESGPIIYFTEDQSYIEISGKGTRINNHFENDVLLSECKFTLNITNPHLKITEQITAYDKKYYVNKDLKLLHIYSNQDGRRLKTVMDPLVLN